MPRRLEGRLAIGHLLRRAAFGPSPATDAALRGRSYEEVVAWLLEGLHTPPEPEPRDFDPYVPGTIQQSWLDRMVGGRAPLAEKLALFWHGHFATSDAKVQDGSLMWRQYRTFRTRGAGRFPALVRAVSRDTAMVIWLDGNSNRRGHPNENFARELQELFVLGIGNYTEQDVREVARAFTGWGTRGRTFAFARVFHDPSPKTIHGRRGPFDGDEVIGLLTSLDACHRHLARSLLSFFSHPLPAEAEVDALARVLKRTKGDVRAALEALFTSASFLDAERHRALVNTPVGFVTAGLSAAGRDRVPSWVQPSLGRMGQILFRPPSVKGWPVGAEWLGSAALMARFDAAHRLTDGLSEADAEAALDRLFDGDLPTGLARTVAGRRPREGLALALASPEGQLA